jgi:hypothetical protein
MQEQRDPWSHSPLREHLEKYKQLDVFEAKNLPPVPKCIAVIALLGTIGNVALARITSQWIPLISLDVLLVILAVLVSTNGFRNKTAKSPAEPRASPTGPGKSRPATG